MEPLAEDDLTGLGRYRFVGLLGSGGMGRVYLGRDRDGRLASVKVVHDNLADDPKFRARFAREVNTALAVRAPWTAAVLDADLDADRPWLATEYLPGATLEDTVDEAGPLTAEHARLLAARLAEALRVLHAGGIIHRDVKPSNVILAADGPRLIDFGIAHAVDATRLTHTGMLLGTPAYMSPEQAGDDNLGTASDIFSLASVLTFATTGRGPFGETANPVSMLPRIVRDEPALASVPEQLRPVLARCLAKEPAERPTAEQLATELHREGDPGWVADRPPPVSLGDLETDRTEVVEHGAEPTEVVDHAAEPTESVRTVVVRAGKPRGNRKLWIALGGAAVVAVVIGVLAWTGAGPAGLPGGDGPLDSPAKISAAIEARVRRDGTLRSSTLDRTFHPSTGGTDDLNRRAEIRVDADGTWYAEEDLLHASWPDRPGQRAGSGDFALRWVLLPGHLWATVPTLTAQPGSQWQDTPLTSTRPDDLRKVALARIAPSMTNPLHGVEPAATLLSSQLEVLDGTATTRFVLKIDPDVVDQLKAGPQARPAGAPKPVVPSTPWTYTLWLDNQHRLLRALTARNQNESADTRFSDWGQPVRINPPPPELVQPS